MNIRKILSLITLIALVSASPASAALFKRAEAKSKTPPPPAPTLPRVEVAVVKRLSTVHQGINTTSTLAALEEVIVNPKVTGRIQSIAAKKGAHVKKGDALIVLDSRTQTAEYNSMKAQVAVAKAELAQSKVSLANAQREYERYSRLRKSGYATQQEYDTRSTTHQAAKAAEAKAAAQVQMAQANLEAQGVTLGEYKLTAPIEGIVLDDYDLTIGALLNTQSSAMRIGRCDRLKARVDIPERDMGRLKLGMDAQLTFESLPGETYYGTVTKIDPYINTNTRTIGAEITVDNRAAGFVMKPGLFARVLLVETSEENPLAIPTEALRANDTVLVVHDGRVRVQTVIPGPTSGGMVTILGGLTLGEDVIVSGGNKVKEGDEVEFVIVNN
ncbi:MAG: efflux RND transporter periplasmic adaptor subunit [Pyramidobacter sp.]|nr:efflux RND transporter periplasmic adaptor subunit [Pyramidobacter sp.]